MYRSPQGSAGEGHSSTTVLWQSARHASFENAMPLCLMRSCGSQQSGMLSLTQRQGPFQMRIGSTLRALRTLASDPSPQKAGSSCVQNCSMSRKKQPIGRVTERFCKHLAAIGARNSEDWAKCDSEK